MMKTTALAALWQTSWALAGCGQAASPAPETDPGAALELRAYEVPGHQADNVRAALSHAFYVPEGQTQVGQASVTQDGMLLILGPPGIQEGVAALVSRVGEGPAPSRATISTEIWVVAGVPGASGPVPPRLAEVGEALATVEQHDGPHRFYPLEKLTVRFQENEQAEIEGLIHVEQTATVMDDRVVGALSIRGLGTELRTHMSIRTDQIVVLGSASATAGALEAHIEPAELGDASSASIFFIIRSSVERAVGTE
jgi:hypothetical protein